MFAWKIQTQYSIYVVHISNRMACFSIFAQQQGQCMLAILFFSEKEKCAHIDFIIITPYGTFIVDLV